MFNNIFFFVLKSCRLWDSVEKCRRARRATVDCILWRMRCACWI